MTWASRRAPAPCRGRDLVALLGAAGRGGGLETVAGATSSTPTWRACVRDQRRTGRDLGVPGVASRRPPRRSASRWPPTATRSGVARRPSSVRTVRSGDEYPEVRRLSRTPAQFIRPSPSAGHLGGVVPGNDEATVVLKWWGTQSVTWSRRSESVQSEVDSVAGMVDRSCSSPSPGPRPSFQGH